MAATLTALALATSPVPATAQENEPDSAALSFGGDRYAAGGDLRLDTETAGDLFAAGEALDLIAPVAGAAHLAGRTIEIDAAPGGPLYAAGYAITVGADLPGPATLFGAEVEIDGALAGNLRLFAREARIAGPLDGAALIAAQEVRFEAPIAGDLMLRAETVEWGEAARVEGQVIVYVAEGESLDVPARVAPPERVTERDLEAFEADVGPAMAEVRRTALRAAFLGFLTSVVVVAALATAAVAVVPERVAQWRQTALDRPGGALVSGFLFLSTLIGAGVVLALTVIGIPFLPALWLAAGLAGYAGYVLGSYILGVGLWLRLGKSAPEGILHKAGLAALGAVVAGLIGLIPFLGWLFVLALALGGLGAIALHSRQSRALAV